MSMLYLQHYGTPHEGWIPHSGRYEFGSGEEQEGVGSFYSQIRYYKSKGMSDKEISKKMDMSIQEIRNRYSNDRNALKQSQYRQALALKDKGYSNSKIGEILGEPGKPMSEATVRNLLKDTLNERVQATDNVAKVLKDAVDKNKYVDIGPGVDSWMGVSSTKIKAAVQKLEDEGYEKKLIQVEQLGTAGNKTTVSVLCPKGTPTSEIYQNKEKIALPIGVKFENGGKEYWSMNYPVSVDPNRVKIRYAEDGGKDMDGVILLRQGAQDLDLGRSHYAQVRILVGEDRYLKGMAMYSDDRDFPKGVDIIFNTNKEKSVPFEKVLKETKKDDLYPNNPFGASIASQNSWVDKDGTKHQGALNIVNEEGSWGDWSKSLSSQFLSKQPVSLVKKQLSKAYDEKMEEYNEIMSLTNPDVKRNLLSAFADDCDSSAVHLKAAAMPRQASHVILPFPDMKDNEIYAPQYKNGETVVLVRYPHGGKFEIPTLTVNNNNKKAKKFIGDAIDGVGINPRVAERLSGADFDGDTVLVIPNNSGAIKTKSPLRGLKDFNPSEAYKAYEGMPKVTKDNFNKQREMGEVSNLITDMTIKGADDDEIARAVRHSMVVIDAEKHNLDWKASYQKNGIAALKEKYQGGKRAGASTLISRATSPLRIDERKQYVKIDPNTGEKIYTKTNRIYEEKKKMKDPSTGETIYIPTGKTKKATTTVKKLEYYNADELSSGSLVETVYANYSNQMKALGNRARKSMIDTPTQKYDSSAAKTYEKEVSSLKSKLNVALKNAPLERRAQLYANTTVQAIRKANPDLEYDDIKKIKGQQLQAARVRVGASKTRINVTEKEWEAIQAGAVTHTTLTKILNNTDADIIKSYATPRFKPSLTDSQVSQIKAMINRNTVAEIADKFGVSASTIYSVVNG